MEEEGMDNNNKIQIDKEKTIEEFEIIKNENNVLNNDNDLTLKTNSEENFLNKNKFSKNNNINNEEINKNIIVNDIFNNINQENINIDINKPFSIIENNNKTEDKNNFQKNEKIFENKSNNKDGNDIKNLGLLEKEKISFNFNNEINNNELIINEKNKELITKEDDFENINDIIVAKEYNTENLEENNKYYDKENNNEEEIELNTKDNKPENISDENDNDLINYKNISFSENKEKEVINIGEKEKNLNNELNTELLQKFIKNKNEKNNDLIELYSYEENENNNKIKENNEYFINQNSINCQKNKQFNDKNYNLEDNQEDKISENKENKIILDKDNIDKNIIKAERFIITNNYKNTGKTGNENDNDDTMENKIQNIDKETNNNKDALKKLQALIKQKELNNNNNNNYKINPSENNIKEKEKNINKIDTQNIKDKKINKSEIYKKSIKKIPYPKFQLNCGGKAINENNLELKLINNNRDALFEKYKTLDSQGKNVNLSNAKKTFNLYANKNSISDYNNITNKFGKYQRNIPYNNYINFFQRSTSKNKNKKNNLSKVKHNKSLFEKYHQGINDFSNDGIIYQKRNIKTHDFSLAKTSRMYHKKGKKRGNTFGKYESNNKKIEIEDNYLYNKETKEKININQKQLYTPINYSKKIPLTGQNQVKNNNYINNINYIYNNNNYNFKNDEDEEVYLYPKKYNRNSYLIMSKQNNNFENITNNKYNNNIDISSDNIYQNEYILNKNNDFNTNISKKKINAFRYQKINKEIYKTMKNFQNNNRVNKFNQQTPYLKNNINFKNGFYKNEDYYLIDKNEEEEEYAENKYFDKNYYLDIINNNININIEDLLILEEKLNEIIYFLKSIKNANNQCLDFWNFFVYSSLNKLEKIYKNETITKIIKLNVNLLLLSVMICYEFSFDQIMMNKSYILILEILEINHNDLIFICQTILMNNIQDYSRNIWIQILNKIVDDSRNDKGNYYIQNLPFYEKINSNNDKLIKKIKDILSNYHTEFSSLISSLFKKINQKNYEQINDFFKEYILRKETDFNTENISTNQVRPPFILSKRKKKFTLILSLDETLVHLEQINNKQCSVKLRPYLIDFLDNMKPYYELILFTSKSQFYTNPVINVIQRNKIYFDFIFYREHCMVIGNDYVKDLTKIGRPLDSTIIIDNAPQHFKLQKENSINIKSFWAQDPNDKALYYLIPILINIALDETDTRDGLEKYKEDIISKITSNIYKLNLSHS